MTDQDKINIQLNIAGEIISVTIQASQRDEVKQAEKTISDLYDNWRIRFPSRTPSQLLAMLAYQFASHYNSLRRRDELAARKLEALCGEITTELDRPETHPDILPDS